MANKSDLIKNVAKETGLTKKNADLVVDAVFNSIQDALADGKQEGSAHWLWYFWGSSSLSTYRTQSSNRQNY